MGPKMHLQIRSPTSGRSCALAATGGKGEDSCFAVVLGRQLKVIASDAPARGGGLRNNCLTRPGAFPKAGLQNGRAERFGEVRLKPCGFTF